MKTGFESPPADTPVTDSSIRVRYAETDRMGVAYYANHLVWFEIGRTDYCRHRGFSYADMERETSTMLMVVEARCRYRGSVTYDDQLIVRTWMKKLRRRGLTFAYRLTRQGDDHLVAEGETSHIVIDQKGRPRSMPEQYFRLLKD